MEEMHLLFQHFWGEDVSMRSMTLAEIFDVSRVC